MKVPKRISKQHILLCGLLAAPALLTTQTQSASAQEYNLAPPIPVQGVASNVSQTASAASDLGAAIEQASEVGAESTEKGATTAATASDTKISYKTTSESGQTDDESKMIAQAAEGSPTSANIDLAPVKLPERTSAGSFDQFQTGLLYKLPAKMFFQGSVENSLRLETNVFQTSRNYRQDMIYRVLPNATIGYALNQRTRISGNYFFLRDQYTRDAHTLSRNIHSFSVQGAHDIPLGEKTTLTLNMAGRQLLLSRGQPLSDLLPGFQLVRRVGARGIIYGGVLGQIRFRNTLGKFQEGDEFYSVGGMYRTPRWLRA